MINLNRDRVYIKDGGISTNLNLRCAGLKYSICEELNVIVPDELEKLHSDYVNVNADILTTNTFGSKQLPEEKAYKVNLEGAKIARRVANSCSREIYVAGSIGIFPIAKSESETEYLKHYKTQVEALSNGDVDFIFVESIWDLTLAKLVTDSINGILEKHNKRIAFSITVHNYSEDSINEFVKIFNAFKPLYLGINCSNEPRSIYKDANLLSSLTDKPLLIAPNAGIPDTNGNHPLNPESFMLEMKPLIDTEKFAIIGGCCGTTPQHIKKMNEYVKLRK